MPRSISSVARVSRGIALKAGAYAQVDAAGVYVTDYGNDRVQQFSAEGAFIRAFGSVGAGAGQFVEPTGIALDGSGNVWVLNTYGSEVQEFSATGTFISGFGSAGAAGALDIAISGGNLYVTEGGKGRVQEYSTAGAPLAAFDERGAGSGKSSLLDGIATDPSTGNLYVSDIGNNNVQEFSAAGSFIVSFGSPGFGNGQFSLPRALDVSSAGVLSVADTANNRVELWVP